MAHQSANASASADGAEASHEPVQTAPREAFVTMETPLTAKFALAVSWNDIQYSVKEGKQNIEILKGLTGTALPGRTLAVMGSSGAGKTTFLNALADRLRRDGTHHLSGTMRLNDLPFDRKYRKLLGFVTQEDIVSPQATPEDALRFSLRIRRGVSASEADRKTAEMLEELKLTAVKDTMVGIPGIISGLSGGEKKRTNIGVELIADPKVMLLDEPTSGLDSVTSSRIVSLCRELSRKGRTVIFTIHQPTAECLQNFDDLMLMCAGGVAYHGTMEAAVPYFSSIGYACPDTYTPTDYFMILLQDKETGPKLVALWTEHLEGGHASAHTMSPTANDGEPVGPAPLSPSDKTVFLMPTGAETKVFLDDYVSKTGSSIGIQFVELMKRSFKGVSRNTLFIGMSIVQGLFFALVAGIMFVNIKDDVPGIQDRFGLLFMVCANRCFGGAMMMINTFPKEKAVFIREQQSGAYSPGIYFLAKSLSELPVQLASQILEALIVYFVAGLHVAPGSFFLYLATCFAAFQAATGLGMAISCAVPSFQLASGLAPLLIVPMMLAGGLLGSVSRLRPYWVWLEKISVIRYAFIILIRNELEPLDHIYCYPNDYTAVNGTAFCANQPKTGKAVLQQFEFTGTSHSYWLMWTCLACWIVAMRLVAVLALNRVAKSKE